MDVFEALLLLRAGKYGYYIVDTPTNSILDINHTQDGFNLLPTLTWSLPPTVTLSSVAEYLIITEDADVPILTSAMHANFYSIPATKTSVAQEDSAKLKGKGMS